MGGHRCDALAMAHPAALEMLRREMRMVLWQIFGFVSGNGLLLLQYGDINTLARDGKACVFGLFGIIYGAGQMRIQLWIATGGERSEDGDLLDRDL